MEKEFIPYNQAFELAKLNFNEKCFGYYGLESKVYIEISCNLDTNLTRRNFLAAPTYSQAFRWFREKYGYFTSPTESDDNITKKYDWLVTKHLDGGKMFIKFIGYKNSYEEAELECLKKLIEIVKK